MALPLGAVEQLTLAIGRADAGAWAFGDVTLALGFPAEDRVSARLTSRGLVLPAPLDTLDTLTVDCPRAEVDVSTIVCAGAALQMAGRNGDSLGLPLAMRVERGDDGWRLHLAAEDLDPGALWRFAAVQGRVPGIDFADGRLSVSLDLGGDAQDPAVGMRARLSGATFSDASGLHAGENLDARLDAALARGAQGWRAKATLAVDAGQVYLDPVFVDAGATPLSLSGEAESDVAAGAPIVARWHLDQRQVAKFAGTARLDGTAIAAIDLEMASAPADPVYRHYLKPFAVGTLFDALRLEGHVQARARWRPEPEGWQAQLDLRDLRIDDTAERFQLLGLGGRVDWRQAGGADATRLVWAGGRVYRIDFGAGTLEGHLAGRRFGLGLPLRVPLLGGAVSVASLEVTAIGTADVQWRFRGEVEPVSLLALTSALGWPSFDGTLGGEIPLVSYARGVVSVDGSLDTSVFDGAVSLRGLSITDPFGVVPVLRADVDLSNLSLDALTRTFSFGNIQGRLQGRVHGLILKDWKPTAFDARFATPDDDDSRHRISQRAVESLASLGGAGAVLSTTFLRLFEEFSYRRLGLGCRLRNGVCEMDGIAPAEPRGYYIVEGGGLPPRIDVLGFNRRVDWAILLSRLRQIVTSDGPVVR